MLESLKNHPWSSLWYITTSAAVVVFVFVIARTTYKQQYEIESLRAEIARIKSAHTTTEGTVGQIRDVVLTTVPEVERNSKAVTTTRSRAAIVQSWQRNVYLGLDKRIDALERWRYSCRCGDQTVFSHLFVGPIADLRRDP